VTYFADEYKIVTASQTASATSATGAWAISAAAFKGTGGGAASSPKGLTTLGVGE
jgi:hypothetical protein